MEYSASWRPQDHCRYSSRCSATTSIPRKRRSGSSRSIPSCESHGAERAHFLLECMIDHARRSGAYLPYSPNTAYLNTIPVGQQPPYPGDREIERRIEAYIRWNAMAMVVHANRKSSEYGGHIASYASSATLYEVGFNHFWRAATPRARRRSHLLPRALVTGDLCARIPRGPPDGRESATTSAKRSSVPAAVVLSASVVDAGVLAVPDGLDGLGPDDGDLPGAVHALSGESRRHSVTGSQGVVLLGRRRDRRARVDGRASRCRCASGSTT